MSSARPDPAPRIPYFDWLRALAVVGIVVYHALLPFTDGWWINNAERSDLLTAVVLFFETFGLPLLFLIAGASASFALRSRTPGAFVRERATRLLVPYLVGVVLLTPPMMYLAAIHQGTTTHGFLAWLAGYPAYAADWVGSIGLSPRLFEIGFHLWFLAWLFCLSALALPLWASLGSDAGRRLIDGLVRVLGRTGSTLLVAIPLAIPPFILFAPAPDERDWWTFAWYGMFLVTGFVLYRDERLVAAVRRDLLPALVVGVAGVIGLTVFGFDAWAETQAEVGFVYDGTYTFMVGLYGLTGWCWTLVLLNLGLRARWMRQPMPAIASRAVLPLYVVHLPIVIGVASVVVEWPLPLLPKAILNVVLCAGLSAAVALLATRAPVIRGLLGVRVRRSAAPAPA